ncbi:hypothetical protein DL769_010504 [Monosporascus sp. CRB-8-3]|nr:hypothetical protein DL769_010504 [Monosporascus sp. CRB-8-3]
MEFGVVPIWVDQVTLWVPTEQQIKNGEASAYAWVDRRGNRALENSVQMKAYDGNMVMEIVNVRITSYKAATPQKPEGALQEAPYGEMAWQRGFDTLETAADLDSLTITVIVNHFLFKYPEAKIIELGFNLAPEVL